VKPAAFEYRRPGTVADVLDMLDRAEPDVALLAGGQSLVRLMNLRAVRPVVVVDLDRVAGLDDVTVTADTVRVGAMVRIARLERDPALRERLPVLSEAAALVGHPQIRSRATLGGSLCHADPAAELPTLAVALGARLRLVSAAGERVVPADEFYRGPRLTVRRPGELLTEVEIPAPGGLRARFVEISRRANDLPLVGVCPAVVLADGVVTAARLGAGGVGSTPVRLPAVERALLGRTPAELAGSAAARRPSDDPLHRALAAAAEETDPPDDPHAPPAFRRALLRAALRRALARLAGVAAR
jgi:carbon-monoxide dehydrogenase medium subunit